MYEVGDIILVHTHLKNSAKYHLSLIKPTAEKPGLFLFLDSESRFGDAIGIDCARIPELSPTRTGLSYICVDRILYTEAYFDTHLPKKICGLAMDIWEELLRFVENTPVIERRHKPDKVTAIQEIIIRERPDD